MRALENVTPKFMAKKGGLIVETTTPRKVGSAVGREVSLVGVLMCQVVKGGHTFFMIRDCTKPDVVVQAVATNRIMPVQRLRSIVIVKGRVEALEQAPEGVSLEVEDVKALSWRTTWEALRVLARNFYRAIPPNFSRVSLARA